MPPSSAKVDDSFCNDGCAGYGTEMCMLHCEIEYEGTEADVIIGGSVGGKYLSVYLTGSGTVGGDVGAGSAPSSTSPSTTPSSTTSAKPSVVTVGGRCQLSVAIKSETDV